MCMDKEMAGTTDGGTNQGMHMHNAMEMKSMEMMSMEGHSKMGTGMMGMDMPMMMMAPQWFTTKSETHFLLKNLKINSITGIILAMLFSILLALVFEAVHIVFNMKSAAFNKRKDKHISRDIIIHVLLTVLKMLSVLVGYLIMLCVMTFNVWLLISAVVGSGVAHLVLRPLLSLCCSSGSDISDTPGMDEDGVRQDLLHDFPTKQEGYNTFSEDRDNNKRLERQSNEILPLVTETSEQYI